MSEPIHIISPRDAIMRTKEHWVNEWPSLLGDRLSFVASIQVDALKTARDLIAQHGDMVVSQIQNAITCLGNEHPVNSNQQVGARDNEGSNHA